MRKKIILAMPSLYKLDEAIEKNLSILGYDVINLCYENSRAYYPTIFNRIKSWLLKIFFGKTVYKEYIKEMIYSRYMKDINDKLSALDIQADFALCIRANVYPRSIISKIKLKSKVCINYQWDGISAHPDILDYMSYFDRFFVFDKADIEKYPEYKLRHSTNFYFDYNVANLFRNNGKAFFLGGYQANRTNQIKGFIDKAKQTNLSLDFYLIAKDNRAIIAFDNDPIIHYIHSSNAFSFEQNLDKVKESFIVVDFLNAVHQGLSFRVFDALCFNKKLITTNETIIDYDFYHPNNILLWNDSTKVEDLKKFIELPYQEINEEIKSKYSFSTWLKSILDD